VGKLAQKLNRRRRDQCSVVQIPRSFIRATPNANGPKILPDGAEADRTEVPAVKALPVPAGCDPNLAVLDHIRAERIMLEWPFHRIEHSGRRVGQKPAVDSDAGRRQFNAVALAGRDRLQQRAAIVRADPGLAILAFFSAMYPQGRGRQNAMRGGLYVPNRASNPCSRKHCAFWRQCTAEFGGKFSVA